MKKLLSESTRFRAEEVPLRQREKQKLFHQYRELEVSQTILLKKIQETVELSKDRCNDLLIHPITVGYVLFCTNYAY